MAEAPTPEYVRSERLGGTVVLTLDHPPVNVLSRPVLERLLSRLAEVGADPAARVVVLASAAEKAFAAGADIREMAPMGPEEAHVHGARGQSVTRAIERLPLPVIAEVHGVCLGGGCEIALACDLIVASDDARFGQPEINLGVMPGWGGTRRLPRRIGAARARRWILTGTAVPAADAAAAGLVDSVVPRTHLRETVLARAEELAAKPPIALAAAKYALLNAIDPRIDDGLAYELDLWARLFGTSGQRRGMEAFLSKQPIPAEDRTDWERRTAGFPWTAGPDSRRGGKRHKPARPKRR